MNVQLLLLVALAGPFCAFTHASPTEIPSHSNGTASLAITTEANKGATEELSVSTEPPTTEAASAPEVHATEVITEAASVTEVNTKAAVAETEAPPAATTEGPEHFATTDQPVVATAVPTEATEADKSEVTAAAKTEAGDGVVVEDGSDEGLSSGQVAGIVIGALLAVVIVIAVVIAVVRRMGNYTSAKNKKPTKKDVMVSPLKKKSAKQQERPRFWKF